MKQHEVTVPQIGLIAGTRAMLGAGIALLLSEKLTAEQRRAIGWTLVAVGAITTIPLVLQLCQAIIPPRMVAMGFPSRRPESLVLCGRTEAADALARRCRRAIIHPFWLHYLEWHDVIESDLTLHHQPKSVAAVNEVGF